MDIRKVPSKRSGLLDNAVAKAAADMPATRNSSFFSGAVPGEEASSHAPAALPATATPFERFRARTGYQPGSVISIPLSALDECPTNPRVIYRTEDLARLGQNLLAEGQREAIHVVIHPNDMERFYVIDGHRRWRGMSMQPQAREILAIVEDLQDPLAWYRFGYQQNTEREAQSDLDNALAWRRLLDQQLIKQQVDIAMLTGRSESYITQVLAMTKLPDPILELMKAEPGYFSYRLSYEVVQVWKRLGNEAAADFARDLLARGASVREAGRLRSRLEAAVNAPPRRRSIRIPLLRDGQSIGTIKRWPDGRVQFSAQSLSDADIDRLTEILQRSLSEQGVQIGTPQGED